MPGALAGPLLIFIEHLNLHCPLGVRQHAARSQGKGPAGVSVSGSRKAGVNVGGCPGEEGTLASLLLLPS